MFLVLAGLVLSFGFIRLSTRLMRSPRVPWWPGSVVSEGGLHIHHLVFGIVLMILAGAISFAGFAVTPIYEICAFIFGIGIGLTIDEFALWLYLDDVYWKEQGRASVDAAVIISALIGLIMLGVRPFEVSDNDASALIGSLIAAIVALATCFVCLLKGRVYHAIFGAFLWPLALYGALRLAKPDSSWARRRYDERDPEKRARAASRFPPDRRTERFKERLRDAIGGTTESEYLSKLKRRG